jgi:hypothetical protein
VDVEASLDLRGLGEDGFDRRAFLEMLLLDRMLLDPAPQDVLQGKEGGYIVRGRKGGWVGGWMAEGCCAGNVKMKRIDYKIIIIATSGNNTSYRIHR